METGCDAAHEQVGHAVVVQSGDDAVDVEIWRIAHSGGGVLTGPLELGEERDDCFGGVQATAIGRDGNVI